MFVSGWLILLAATIVIVAMGLLCLALRRALNEMLFWRGAFVHTSEQVHELLEEACEPGAVSPLARYAEVLDCVFREATVREIEWIGAGDAEFFRSKEY